MNHSIVIADKHNYGAIGDLSLSGDKTALSMSIWVKIAAGDSGLSMMGNNKSSTGMGGSSLLCSLGYNSAFEMMAENIAYQPAWGTYAVDGVFGLISPTPPVTRVGDGLWYNVIGTYSSRIIPRTVISIVDGTHLHVDDTTGIVVGDRIYQNYWSTLVIGIVDSTHLQVQSTTSWIAFPFVAGGIHLYINGVEVTSFTDYEYTLFYEHFSCDIPFGIGDPEHLNYHSLLGKYAYPAVYHRILSAAEIAAIAAGNAVTAGAEGLWLFTEGSGLTAADVSGNNRTLIFNNVAWDTDVPFAWDSGGIGGGGDSGGDSSGDGGLGDAAGKKKSSMFIDGR